MRQRRCCVVFFAVLIAFVLVALCVLLHSSSPSCWVTASIPAITNDAAGARQATFRISNAGRHQVALVPTFLLENHSGQWQTNRIPGGAVTLRTNLVGNLPFHPRSKILAPQEVFEVAIPLPFDDQAWRAAFTYLEIRPPLEDAARAIFRRIGVKNLHKGQRGQSRRIAY